MKTYVFVFTLGLLLGLFLSFMYRTILVDAPPPSVSKQSVVALQKEVNKSEVSYAKSFDSLERQSKKLEVELAGTKKTLGEVKKQNRVLQTRVYSLISRERIKEPEDKSCDSLITSVEYLMQSNAEKDSLYEVATLSLEGQVRNKDSTIVLKDVQYQSLRSAFDKTLSNQQQLLNENKLLGKQVRKQKVKSKLLSAAIFIFSGVAINHLLRH